MFRGKWIRDEKLLVSFTINGSKVTPLLYKSNLPITGYMPKQHAGYTPVFVGNHFAGDLDFNVGQNCRYDFSSLFEILSYPPAYICTNGKP